MIIFFSPVIFWNFHCLLIVHEIIARRLANLFTCGPNQTGLRMIGHELSTYNAREIWPDAKQEFSQPS